MSASKLPPKLTPWQHARLQEFAAMYGPQWRDKLRELWLTGKDSCQYDGHLLRQVRNQVGPHRLDDVNLDDVNLDDANPEDARSKP